MGKHFLVKIEINTNGVAQKIARSYGYLNPPNEKKNNAHHRTIGTASCRFTCNYITPFFSHDLPRRPQSSKTPSPDSTNQDPHRVPSPLLPFFPPLLSRLPAVAAATNPDLGHGRSSSPFRFPWRCQQSLRKTTGWEKPAFQGHRGCGDRI